MVNSQAGMLEPGSKESILARARSRVSCTRSSARSTLPESEIANARRLGTAARTASRTEGSRVMVPGPSHPSRRDASRARQNGREPPHSPRRHRWPAADCRSWPVRRVPDDPDDATMQWKRAVFPSVIRLAYSVYAVSYFVLAARPWLGYGEM